MNSVLTYDRHGCYQDNQPTVEGFINEGYVADNLADIAVALEPDATDTESRQLLTESDDLVDRISNHIEDEMGESRATQF